MRIGRRRFGNYVDLQILNSKKSKSVKYVKGAKTIVVLLGVMVALVFLVSLLGNVFKVQKIDLVFDQYPCGNETDVSESLRISNQVIFWINEYSINRRMKNDFPCIKDVRVDKYLPNKVAVLVSGRRPVALLVKGEGLNGLIDLAQVEATAASAAATIDFSIPVPTGDKFFMDDEGVLFYNTMGDVNLPVIYVNNDLSLKMNMGVAVGWGVRQVFGEIRKIGFIPKLVKINSASNMLITDEKGVKVVLNLKEDLLKQLASLQLIWQKNKIDSKRIESIDLRFSKPVVIYSK